MSTQTKVRRASPDTKVIGLMLVTGGVCWLLHETGTIAFTWRSLGSLPLMALGAGMLLTARSAKKAGPIGLGLLLLVLLLALSSVPMDIGRAPQLQRPASATDLRRSYSMSFGDYRLDLSGIELPPGTRALEVNVAMGKAIVVVPKSTPVSLDMNIFAGSGEVFGRRSGAGFVFDNAYRDEGYSGAERRLSIRLNGFASAVEVRRG